MGIPHINLTQNDLSVLAIIVDGYLKSLLQPYVYPEHSAQHSWTLQQLKAKFQTLAKKKSDTQILLTELDVISLDEAVEGFIRICERSKQSPRRTQIPIARLNEFRRQLAAMKLPEI
jgi:hypothetical protein